MTGQLNRNGRFNSRMTLIILQRKILVLEIKDSFDCRIQFHGR